MVKEIGMASVPTQEGYVGNLSESQDAALKEIWDKFFECCEKATGSKSKGDGNKDLNGNVDDPKDADIPKGDAAKEEAKRKEEEQAMQDLMKEYGGEALNTTFWRLVKFDNPDTIMLRFLRARKWDVSRAIAMLAGCLKWRLDNGVEELAEQGDLLNGEKVEKFLDQQRSGKTYALGTALNEQPICYIHVAKHFTRGQPQESMQKYVIYAMESFRLLIQPPNDKAVILFDMTGFGIKNMDWNCVLFIVKCLEAYFPESLGILYIHNAPWIFSGIWKVLSPLLDPVVRSKIKFTKNPKDMEDRVPAERFLDSLNGSMTSKFEFIEPQEGENDLHNKTEERQQRFDAYIKWSKEYEEATRKWIKGDKQSDETRKILAKKLRVAQFEMEPYFRGKTVTHRDGTLDGQGVVTWLYKQKNGEAIRHIVGRRDCVAVMKREIQECENGSTAADAEKKSAKALQDEDWITLYGDERTARQIEGPRVDGKVPEEGWTSDQTKLYNGKLSTQETQDKGSQAAGAAVGAGAAAGAGAGAAAGTGAATSSDNTAATPNKEDFKDVKEAQENQVEKAVDGDKKVNDKADEVKPSTDDKPQEPKTEGNDTVQNGDAKSAEPKSPVSAISQKAKDLKVEAEDKGKSSSIGRRLGKMFKA